MKIAAPMPARPTTPPTTPPTIAPIFVVFFFEAERLEVGEEADVDCAIEALLRPGVAAIFGVVAVMDSYALRKESSATDALT